MVLTLLCVSLSTLDKNSEDTEEYRKTDTGSSRGMTGKRLDTPNMEVASLGIPNT
jgi:hypothetical protein